MTIVVNLLSSTDRTALVSSILYYIIEVRMVKKSSVFNGNLMSLLVDRDVDMYYKRWINTRLLKNVCTKIYVVLLKLMHSSVK